MATPDWQLPPGVDRGLWDYLCSEEMVRGYDEQIAAAPLSRADVAFCEKHFTRPGRLLDLGCGTGRLCVHFAKRGFDCVGVDLSAEMLAKAKENADVAGVSSEWKEANLIDLAGVPDASFDYAACLFSTLGMIRGNENRVAALKSAHRVLKPGGTFVLHAHNRYFRGLGWKKGVVQRWRALRGSPTAGDVTMPQAYGGAPLTLHHFTRSELVGLLEGAGFRVEELIGVSEDGDTGVSLRTCYGFLAACRN